MKKPKKKRPKRTAPPAPAASAQPWSHASSVPAPVPDRKAPAPVGQADNGRDAEPTAATSKALPIVLVALLGLLLYQADIYLAHNSGGFSAMVYYPYKEVPEPPGAGNLVKLGQNVYGRNCGACHQPNGAGNAALGFPPLAGSDWVGAEGPNRMIRIVLNGLAGPITVNGQEYGTVAMVPWRDTLTDEQIAAVLTYVRQAWGNTASPVSASQVTAIRQATESRGTRTWTAQELLAIPVSD